MLRADSHDSATKKRVEELVGGRAVDFLFIDGDHSREGVENDYRAYAPLVRAGGAIAFHDIHPGPSSLVGGVPEFWKERKTTVEHEELVDSEAQEGYGIGLVKV